MNERFFKIWFIFVGLLSTAVVIGGLVIGIKTCNYLTSGQAVEHAGQVIDK